MIQGNGSFGETAFAEKEHVYVILRGHAVVGTSLLLGVMFTLEKSLFLMEQLKIYFLFTEVLMS